MTRMNRKTPLAVATLAAIGGAATAASASPTPGNRVAVSAAPAWLSHATRVAAAPPQAAVELTITLRSPHAAAAQAFARSVSEPGSPSFRHFLTPAQYQSRFGPATSAVSQVRSWLAGQGFKITHQGIGYLTVSGPVRDAEAAFGTQLSTFKRNGQKVMAPTSAVTVPAALGSSVQSVLGLDTSATFHSDIATQAQLAAKIARQEGIKLPKNLSPGATADGGCSRSWGQNQTAWVHAAPTPLSKVEPDAVCGYTPQQLDAARGITSTGLNGSGVTAGIILWCDDPNLVSDVNQWASNLHVAQLKPGQATIDQPSQPYESYCTQNDGADQIETSLDAEAIHAVAPAANIVYSPAVGPDDAGLVDALHRIIDTDAVNIVNNSYGEPESELTPDAEAAFESVLTQAAAEGITVLAASGDRSDNFTSGTPFPDYPASDPWITSVGGTSLGLANSNHVAFEQGWFTTFSLYLGIDGGWTGTSVGSAWGYGYGGGGGVSALFAQPSYQQGVVPARLAGTTPMRVYPDIANIADPATGFLMGYTYQPLGNFYMANIGGTSLASPFTVGQIALAIQHHGGPLGFVNPVIYKSGSTSLTDLTSNTVNEGVEFTNAITAAFGLGPVSEALSINGQSLVQGTTLSLAPGYDNLSGMGVPSNEARFISLLNSPV
jgi:subtilase family serine protease